MAKKMEKPLLETERKEGEKRKGESEGEDEGWEQSLERYIVLPFPGRCPP
jgi:hypothetical protein